MAVKVTVLVLKLIVMGSLVLAIVLDGIIVLIGVMMVVVVVAAAAVIFTSLLAVLLLTTPEVLAAILVSITVLVNSISNESGDWLCNSYSSGGVDIGNY